MINIFFLLLHYASKVRLYKKLPYRIFLPFIIIYRLIIGKKDIPYLEVFITTKCNLKCMHCSSLINYNNDQKHIDSKELLQSIKNIINKSDKVYRFKLHGGEVLLHPELADIIEYVNNESKILSARITTNGSIIPSDNVINSLKKSDKFKVQISIYKNIIDLSQIKQVFKDNNIPYILLDNNIWYDYGKVEYTGKSAFNTCTSKKCTSSINNKIYICSRAAMADYLGLVEETNYVNISSSDNISKDIKILLNTPSKSCFYCNGTSNMVIPAIQYLNIKIYAVITTKNRISFLKNALYSVIKQTFLPYHIIVVSDSNDNIKEQEYELIQNISNLSYIHNKFASNYAGSLNTAVDFIVKKELFNNINNADNIYLAFLDDDDTWCPSYIETINANLINRPDFLVSGIKYKRKTETIDLSIPQTLHINDFLKGNPHIQGSNTFIKFSTLLKAGAFDENLTSSTDRDLFVRVMMLEPVYKIINQYLVNVDGDNNRERITTSSNKVIGLKYFYYKYHKLMDEEVKTYFFDRVERLFGIKQIDILQPYFNDYAVDEDVSYNIKSNNEIIIGFTVTSKMLGLRLLNNIIEQHIANLTLIIFQNFIDSIYEYVELLENHNIKYKIFDITSVQNLLSNESNFIYFNELMNIQNIVTDIAISRSILQYLLYKFSHKESIIIVLDDDMEFSYLIEERGKISSQKINIEAAAVFYKYKYDAVVGGYTLDAPLPAFYTMRTSLLDYLYDIYPCDFYYKNIFIQDNYYYDLFEDNRTHLEFPQPLYKDKNIAEIFSGKSLSRPLVKQHSSEKTVLNRGGITIIYNRNMLLLPNVSINIHSKIGRRSDYFWVLKAVEHGYSVSSVPLYLLHNREITEFNIDKELDKVLKDLLGSSFVKAYSVSNDRYKFYENFIKFFNNRLSLFIASYFRINGLLSIISEHELIPEAASEITTKKLKTFVQLCFKYCNIEDIYAQYDKLINIKINFNLDCFLNILKELFGKNIYVYLGHGSEGIVVTDKVYIYKIFYEDVKLDNTLIQLVSSFNKIKNISIYHHKSHTIIKYPYIKMEKYNGGYADKLINFINYLKDNNIYLKNIKPDNFMIYGDDAIYIDYGKDVLLNNGNFNYGIMFERIFQLVKYAYLGPDIFKQIVYISHKKEIFNNLYHGLMYGYENMMSLLYQEYNRIDLLKNNIHIKNSDIILDYGAGKCKLAKLLSASANDFYVYDIDTAAVKRFHKQSNIYTDIKQIPDSMFDVVLCNRVICSINNDELNTVLYNISKCLKINGKLYLSICNPFFNSKNATSVQSIDEFEEYAFFSKFDKHMKQTSNTRVEYHRPFKFYQYILQKYGFKIEKITELGEYVDVNTLEKIGLEMMFTCKYIKPVNMKSDISLLIKTNPMEHEYIYDNIFHIVSQLEKGFIFKEKLVVVNDVNTNRVRRYAEDDLSKLKYILNGMKTLNLIDKIIYESDYLHLQKDIYAKYFNNTLESNVSQNGQPLFATLLAFDMVNTKYLYQTDSDIIFNTDYYTMDNLYKIIEENQEVVTLSLGISNSIVQEYGRRTEVRTCMLAMERLTSLLPLDNKLDKNQKYCLAWHRALDQKIINSSKSIRLDDTYGFFIHPENSIKDNPDFIGIVRSKVEHGCINSLQYDNVNLSGTVTDWIETSSNDVILYIRGRNTPAYKLKRLFESIRMQSYQDYQIIYVDDYSENESAEYAKIQLFHYQYKHKPIMIENKRHRGELYNLDFAMKYIISNPSAVIINIDNDDFLLNSNALNIIMEEFKKGADLTVGNCFRSDKPSKEYRVTSFKNVWLRNGDNIWLHPKCFKAELYKYVTEDFKKIDGNYIDVNTDFAVMLPMVINAKKPVFINDMIYYFEPSKENHNKQGQYDVYYKQKIKKYLLEQARSMYEKNHFSNR